MKVVHFHGQYLGDIVLKCLQLCLNKVKSLLMPYKYELDENNINQSDIINDESDDELKDKQMNNHMVFNNIIEEELFK